MAALICSVTTGEIALAAATAKKVLHLKAAANHRVKLLSWGCYFDGVSVTDAPVVVSMCEDTATGSITGTALTEVKHDRGADETIQTAGLHTVTAGTSGDTAIKTIEVHPQQGYEFVAPMGQEYIIPGSVGVYWSITAPAVVNVTMYAVWEE